MPEIMKIIYETKKNNNNKDRKEQRGDTSYSESVKAK